MRWVCSLRFECTFCAVLSYIVSIYERNGLRFAENGVLKLFSNATYTIAQPAICTIHVSVLKVQTTESGRVRGRQNLG